MSVTLRPLEPGLWSVGRGAERYAGRVSLLQRNVGWELTFTPDDPGRAVLGQAVVGFDTFRAVRAWLEHADGQTWLDSLPRQP